MGFSTTIAAAFAAIIMITGLVIILTTGMSSLDTITSSISDQVSSAEVKLGQTCSLGRLVEADSHTIRMNITNTGDTPITVRDLSKIDVLVIYRTALGTSTTWVKYVQGGIGERWTVTSVYFNGGKELMNPITLTPQIYGVWDPLETLEVEIHLNAMTIGFDSIIITLPSGYRTMQSSLMQTNFGNAVISTGNLTTTIYHQLAGIPKNIQLTPQSNVNGQYWVSNMTSLSFNIHLNLIQTYDVSFFWFAQK